MPMLSNLQTALTTLQKEKPLVLCLSNYVTQDFVANCLLALGAAPLMCEAIEEIDELVHISHAIYLNIGTLNASFMERALQAAKVAKELNKPIILDPVGAGASQLRSEGALRLLPYAAIIRGNASEIMALTGLQNRHKGVESTEPVLNALNSARLLASTQQTIVVSGPEDFLCNGREEKHIPYGSALMPFITGMGCAMTGVLSAFAASQLSPFEAALYGSLYFSLCGQQAEQQTKTPGAFRTAFIDSLFSPDWKYFQNNLKD